MKSLFLFVALFVGFFSFAQRNLEPTTIPTKPIKIQNGKLYIDGEQYSQYEIKNHLKNNSYEAYNFYKKYKTKSSVGGLLLGLGGALLIGDVVKAAASDEDYPGGFSYVGAGLAAASIPILSGRKKHLQKSIDTYNDGLSKEKTLGFNFDVEVVSNQNGMGLNIRF